MEFMEWFKKQGLLAQAMMLSTMMTDVEKNMAMELQKIGFTREEAKANGLSQAYKAGEGETDLRWRWNQWREMMANFDLLIEKLEAKARG